MLYILGKYNVFYFMNFFLPFYKCTIVHVHLVQEISKYEENKEQIK